MYELTDSQKKTARVIADGFLQRLITLSKQVPDVTLGEQLLATSMVLAAEVRFAYGRARPISAELVAAVLDLVHLDVLKHLVSDYPDYVTPNVAARIPELELRRSQLDLLSAADPAGSA